MCFQKRKHGPFRCQLRLSYRRVNIKSTEEGITSIIGSVLTSGRNKIEMTPEPYRGFGVHGLLETSHLKHFGSGQVPSVFRNIYLFVYLFNVCRCVPKCI